MVTIIRWKDDSECRQMPAETATRCAEVFGIMWKQVVGYLLSQYNLSIDHYFQMFDEQAGCCSICRRPATERRLVVDHCHETGKVRGLLCYGCNIKLGKLEKDRGGFTYLQAILDYLGRKN